MNVAITASLVKELRDKTGAGMMECKKALESTNGDLEAAVDELRKQGQKIADKKAGRSTSEGLIFSRCEGNVGCLVEINCESDFVARNENFLAFGKQVADFAFTTPEVATADTEATLAMSSDALGGKSVKDAFTDTIAHIGENLTLGSIVRFEAAEGTGCVTAYIHPPGKLGVLVELKVGKAESLQSETLVQLGKDLAMQVAAASPVAVDKDSVPADLIERERKVARAQCEESGKPEQIWDKIVEGKVNSYFKEYCLINQVFIKDSKQTITDVTNAVAKELGDTIEIVRFERMAVGAKAEQEQEEVEA